jgi:hypothetical protein
MDGYFVKESQQKKSARFQSALFFYKVYLAYLDQYCHAAQLP